MKYIHIKKNNKNLLIVDLKREKNKIFSELAIKEIKKYLKKDGLIFIFTKKTSYASEIICQDCGYTPYCQQCDIPISRHKGKDGKFYGLCHICKTQYNYPHQCPSCGGTNFREIGIGAEKIKEYLINNFNLKDNQILITSSEKLNSPNKIKNFFQELEKAKIIISTPILSTGLNIISNTSPFKTTSISFIVIQNADIGLNIPDFQTNYKNFIYLYEILTNYNVKNFIIQTYKPENISLKYAVNLDFDGFKKEELKFRKTHNYPPFTQMAVLLYKNEIESRVFSKVNKLYEELLYLKQKYQLEDLEIYPTPPLIYKMFGKYRYNIILKSKTLRDFLEIAYEKLKIYKRGFKIDWMPNELV